MAEGPRAGADGWSVLVIYPIGEKNLYAGMCRKRALMSSENEQKECYNKISVLECGFRLNGPHMVPESWFTHDWFRFNGE